ncbi:MAG: TetR/AcrR family transcriptional regulator [Agarilytica sp.]
MAKMEKDLYKPRKTPTQDRAITTFNAILDAAARLLTTKGYSYASTNRIAEVAGVSIGSLYEYFPGKEAIFCAIRMRTGRDLFKPRTQQIIDSRNLSLSELIRNLIEETIESIMTYPELEAAIQSEVPAYILKEQTKQLFDQMTVVTRVYFENHLDEIRPHDFDTAIWLGLRVPVITITHALLNEPELLREKVFAEELIDMMSRFWLKDT